MQKKAEEGLCSIARVFPADRGPRSSVWTDEDEEEDRGDGVGKGRKNGRVYSAGGSFAINCCDEQAAVRWVGAEERRFGRWPSLLKES